MDEQPDVRIDAAQFRHVMGSFATGVTLIAARWPDGAIHAMTANAFMSGSLHPPLCVVSIGRVARMHACLQSADRFSVSILGRHQEAVSNYFAGRRSEEIPAAFVDVAGAPVLFEALAYVVCQRVAAHDCGDHTLFIGEIGALRRSPGEPLLYHDGQYGAFRKGGHSAPADIDPLL